MVAFMDRFFWNMSCILVCTSCAHKIQNSNVELLIISVAPQMFSILLSVKRGSRDTVVAALVVLLLALVVLLVTFIKECLVYFMNSQLECVV